VIFNWAGASGFHEDLKELQFAAGALVFTVNGTNFGA
jgi:hypothetical protein